MAFKRVHVIYSGRVQGVGFRWTVRSIASGLKLNGWVKNLQGGNVELLCEGEDIALEKLMEMIESEFPRHYIKNKEVIWGKPTKEFKGFNIVF